MHREACADLLAHSAGVENIAEKTFATVMQDFVKFFQDMKLLEGSHNE